MQGLITWLPLSRQAVPFARHFLSEIVCEQFPAQADHIIEKGEFSCLTVQAHLPLSEQVSMADQTQLIVHPHLHQTVSHGTAQGVPLADPEAAVSFGDHVESTRMHRD